MQKQTHHQANQIQNNSENQLNVKQIIQSIKHNTKTPQQNTTPMYNK